MRKIVLCVERHGRGKQQHSQLVYVLVDSHRRNKSILFRILYFCIRVQKNAQRISKKNKIKMAKSRKRSRDGYTIRESLQKKQKSNFFLALSPVYVLSRGAPGDHFFWDCVCCACVERRSGLSQTSIATRGLAIE